MKMQLQRTDTGSTLICALCTIVIVSLIGANVLMNCASRYNVSAKQLKGWKEALYAAEGGGDIGFAQVRQKWNDSSNWPWSSGTVYFGEANSLSTSVTVDKLTYTPTPPDPNQPGGYKYYRIRATGTATLFGLPRVGMDDAFLAGGTNFAANASTRGVGDSLLRKIDFKYDHFKATYGDGDGNNLALQTVPNPQITRRIELVAVPIMAFTGALKVISSFQGPGSAGVTDSYDSRNGAYDPSVVTNPSSPYYPDSRNGDVSVATPNFTEGGAIYGNVTTNGGNVTRSGTNISGTIDNNVPFTIPPLDRPDTSGWPAGPANYIITPGVSATNPLTPAQYVYSSGLTSGVTILASAPGTETYVTIFVDGGDINQNIVISNHVNAKIYFTKNLSTKATQIVNSNVDNGRAGHLQFYGISPPVGTTQTIDIAPPGDLYAAIYAPGHDMTLTGNVNVYGAIVANSFTGNGNGGGNTTFHYDKQLNVVGGIVTGYQLASYVEDVR